MPPTSTTLDAEKAARLRSRAAGLLDQISTTAEHLIVAIRACVEKRRTVGEDKRLTHDAKMTSWAEADAELGTAIDQIDERRLQARRQLDGITAEPDLAPTSPEEALLAEMRLSRAWARALRLLDAGQDAIEVATQAAADGQRDVFHALRAEWPAYARAESPPKRAEKIEDTIRVLDELEAPLLSGVEAAARELQSEGAKLDVAAQQAVGWARNDGHQAASIPGPDGSLMHVSTADLASAA